MQRRVQHIAASLAAATALSAAAAAMTPAVDGSGLYSLFESLMLLRDGHGARPLSLAAENPRRTP